MLVSCIPYPSCILRDRLYTAEFGPLVFLTMLLEHVSMPSRVAVSSYVWVNKSVRPGFEKNLPF